MGNFQCCARIINRLFCAVAYSREVEPASHEESASSKHFWQQQSDAKKGRRKAGLFNPRRQMTRRSVLRRDRTAEPVVDASGDDIDVLTDTALSRQCASREGYAVVHEVIGLVLHEHVIVFDAGRPVRMTRAPRR